MVNYGRAEYGQVRVSVREGKVEQDRTRSG